MIECNFVEVLKKSGLQLVAINYLFFSWGVMRHLLIIMHYTYSYKAK